VLRGPGSLEILMQIDSIKVEMRRLSIKPSSSPGYSSEISGSNSPLKRCSGPYHLCSSKRLACQRWPATSVEGVTGFRCMN